MAFTQSSKGKIKILLVDDSPIALAILKRILSSSSDIQVIGTALNGKKAMQLIPILNPDVVCTDLNMPIMDGLELTKQIMTTHPKPILVVSANVQEEYSQNVFNLLEAGALDVYPKPRKGLSIRGDYSKEAELLIEKIKTISKIKVSKPKVAYGSNIINSSVRIKQTKSTKFKLVFW